MLQIRNVRKWTTEKIMFPDYPDMELFPLSHYCAIELSASNQSGLYKLLYKRSAKVMENGHFRPLILRKPLTKLEQC